MTAAAARSDREAAVLLCRHCALRPNIPETPTCRECLWRLTQLAFYPERFSSQEVDSVATAHHDVVAFAVSTGGVSQWVWTADGWPGRKDATTLQ